MQLSLLLVFLGSYTRIVFYGYGNVAGFSFVP